MRNYFQGVRQYINSKVREIPRVGNFLTQEIRPVTLKEPLIYSLLLLISASPVFDCLKPEREGTQKYLASLIDDIGRNYERKYWLNLDSAHVLVHGKSYEIELPSDYASESKEPVKHKLSAIIGDYPPFNLNPHNVKGFGDNDKFSINSDIPFAFGVVDKGVNAKLDDKDDVIWLNGPTGPEGQDAEEFYRLLLHQITNSISD